MTDLAAPEPIEAPRYAVGRRSLSLAGGRGSAPVSVECWHPAVHASAAPRSEYEVLPGVAFRSAVAVSDAALAPGPWPVIVFSHGRTGTSIAYSSLCEALAARGSIVLAPLHAGDALGDWLSGTQVDDRTNEANRLADAAHLVSSLVDGSSLPVDLAEAADLGRLVIAGHSYGAYTALASAAAGTLPVAPSAVMVFQPYTRMMADSELASVEVPTLFVVSDSDGTTPASSDADRPWSLVSGRPAWRLDLVDAGHQAASDTALYAELADSLPALPELVRAYLAASVDRQPEGRGWRDVVRVQVDVAWSFASAAWGTDEPATSPPPTMARLVRRDA